MIVDMTKTGTLQIIVSTLCPDIYLLISLITISGIFPMRIPRQSYTVLRGVKFNVLNEMRFYFHRNNM